jgi:hypothetical protein
MVLSSWLGFVAVYQYAVSGADGGSGVRLSSLPPAFQPALYVLYIVRITKPGRSPAAALKG